MSDTNVIPLFLVPRGAQPRPHVRLTLEEVRQFRFLECAEYSGCLNFAAQLNWSGFHCVRCGSYQKHHEALAEKYGLSRPAFEEQLVAIGAVQQPSGPRRLP
ncbi:MAG: hypothetical protein IT381_13710 [Deltaproteobacteria bacterium]|nr:hypothetical protein [Deltaproteobacteria bacterium]